MCILGDVQEADGFKCRRDSERRNHNESFTRNHVSESYTRSQDSDTLARSSDIHKYSKPIFIYILTFR